MCFNNTYNTVWLKAVANSPYTTSAKSSYFISFKATGPSYPTNNNNCNSLGYIVSPINNPLVIETCGKLANKHPILRKRNSGPIYLLFGK